MCPIPAPITTTSPRIGHRWRALAAAVLAAAALLAGCAATGPKGAEVADQVARVPAGKARIVIYRDASFVGAAVQPQVMVDSEPAGVSKPGSFFYADVPPGQHEVSARTEVTSSVSLQVSEGQTRYVRTAITMGAFVGRVQFTLVEADEAQRVMPGLAYTGAVLAGSGGGAAPSRPSEPAPGAAARQVTLDDLDGLLKKAP